MFIGELLLMFLDKHCTIDIRHDKKVIGEIKYSRNGYIRTLWVDPNNRRKGLGKDLVKRAIDDMWSPHVRLFSMHEAVSFWKAMGFVEVEKQRMYKYCPINKYWIFKSGL
jgi:N-acetylglutamate synthase-like GNAT family acetyltransferase